MGHLKYLLFFLSTLSLAQTKLAVKGQFHAVENKPIMLRGYNGLEEVKFDESMTDSNGNFTVQYPADYVGAALLEIRNGKQLIVLLNHENFEIPWDDLNNLSTLKFRNSAENEAFDQGLNLYQSTEEKKAGILYLLPFYGNEPKKQQFFTTELAYLKNVMPDYLAQLPDASYVRYYLKIRVLIADLQISVKRYPERIPELAQDFDNLDFSDGRLVRSGLYKELLETYFTAIEGFDDQKSTRTNRSVDVILDKLKSQPELKQNVAAYLFNSFEKRSLFSASEHLALKMLDDESCQLEDKNKALFEQYRKMAVGNTAPDISFSNSKSPVKQLSGLKNKYKLVVFGASWCPKCVEEIPKLKTFYADWKKKYDLELVLISLDTQKNEFLEFTKTFPWISSGDLKGWETQAARDYYVFATPTLFLLDSGNKIVLKPTSAEQIDSWLAYHKL